MKNKTIIIFLILLVSISLFAADYEMKEYNIDINVAKNNVYTVNNNYLFVFSSPKHGIYLDIPYKYDERIVEIRVLDTSPNCVEQASENGYKRYRFGTDNETYTGEKDYFFNYDYDFGIDTNDSYDEFYFNIIGPSWQMPINKCNFTITLPEGTEDYELHFTRGAYGSTDSTGIDFQREGNIITGTASDFGAGEALTIRVELEDGFFVGARDFISEKKNAFLFILGLIIICLIALYFLFQKFGRDNPLIITARASAPEDMSPLDVGYIVDNTVDDKDVTTMLFYWADLGYIKINEEKVNPNKLQKLINSKGSTVVTFEKIKELEQGKEWEKLLFNEFFACGDGTIVCAEDLKGGHFYETIGKIKFDVTIHYKKEAPLYHKKQNKFSLLGTLSMLLILGATFQLVKNSEFGILLIGLDFAFWIIQAILIGNIVNTWNITKAKYVKLILKLIPTAAFFFCNLIFLKLAYVYNPEILALFLTIANLGTALFMPLIKKRTKQGTELMEKALGLKEYIEKVEMDQLKMMIDKDPEYYYHILSYAIVLGLEEKWAHKFDGLVISEPSWYRGTGVITPLYFSALATSCNNNLITAAMPEVSSSSGPGGSSMGSSGFSGGGFGGGGGGAW